MSIKNVQFSVATHIMGTLAYRKGADVTSNILAGSVNAEPSFIRRTVAKLAKAGLISTTRGKNGACRIAKKPEDITLLDIYRASGSPPALAFHTYPVQPLCAVSRNIKSYMTAVSETAQSGFEAQLERCTLKEFIDGINKLEASGQ